MNNVKEERGERYEHCDENEKSREREEFEKCFVEE